MTTPPFSPILMGGLLLRAVPPGAIQPLVDRIANLLQDRHPGIFDRLTPLGPRTFVLDPIDLPWVFRLFVANGDGEVTALRREDEATAEADATIRAPLTVMFGLLDGTIDGDAMFFSRDMTYEGDTEAVVALRNALDGAGVDLAEDIAASCGPLEGTARTALGALISGVSRLNADLSLLGDALVSPAVRRSEAQQRRIDELEERCARLEKMLRRSKSVPT